MRLFEQCRVGAVLRISIHAPQWGATHREAQGKPGKSNFNPRTPVGCDLLLNGLRASEPLFQSTHPSGVRHGHTARMLAVENISIHAPQWGATASSRYCPAVAQNFNPRTPVGCDEATARTLRTGDISIHAPQWGATYLVAGPPIRHGISIHAPQWGATSRRTAWRAADRISIHAPQWGATIPRIAARYSSVFQSTHPSGVRLTSLSLRRKEPKSIFQSTHPSGVRHAGVVAAGQPCVISIHAPQWGATY